MCFACYRLSVPAVEVTLFFNYDIKCGRLFNATPSATLTRGKRSGIHYNGCRVCLGTGLEECGKYLPHRDSNPEPSNT